MHIEVNFVSSREPLVTEELSLKDIVDWLDDPDMIANELETVIQTLNAISERARNLGGSEYPTFEIQTNEGLVFIPDDRIDYIVMVGYNNLLDDIADYVDAHDIDVNLG